MNLSQSKRHDLPPLQLESRPEQSRPEQDLWTPKTNVSTWLSTKRTQTTYQTPITSTRSSQPIMGYARHSPQCLVVPVPKRQYAEQWQKQKSQFGPYWFNWYTGEVSIDNPFKKKEDRSIRQPVAAKMDNVSFAEVGGSTENHLLDHPRYADPSWRPVFEKDGKYRTLRHWRNDSGDKLKNTTPHYFRDDIRGARPETTQLVFISGNLDD